MATAQKKINVLQLITSLNIGGTEKYLLSIVRALRKKYNISVGYIKTKGEIGKQLEREGITLYHLPGLWKICSFIKRHDIHVVHTHLYRANIIGRIAAMLRRVPVLISSQQSIDKWKKFYHVWLDRWTSYGVDCIIVNADATKKILQERERIPPYKIHTIYNGIDCSVFSPHTTALYHKNTGEKSQLRVVTVTRLHKEKGSQYIPDIVSSVIKEVSNVQFSVIGDGPLRKNIQRQIHNLNIADKIKLLGWQQDIPGFLAESDVFFLPSVEESFSQAVLEAMSMAVPVVATDVGGMHELVAHSISGLLVQPDVPQAIAQAIIELLKDNSKARRMGEAGKKRVQKFFRVETMLEKTLEIYEQYIHKKRGIVQR